MSPRDISLLRHILRYCEQIGQTSEEFCHSKARFEESATFRNAVCLCLLQIGELAAGLSDAFKRDHPDIAWREIKLLRNIVAHRYGQIDYEIIWDICSTDIPELAAFCENFPVERQGE